MGNSTVVSDGAIYWREPGQVWAILGLCGLIFAFAFSSEAMSLLDAWQTQEEYSHGFLIPLISLFLIYQKRDQLDTLPFTGAWSGALLVLFGCALHLAGRLAVVSTLGQYSLVICITGLVLAFIGWRAFKVIWVALFMLIFMVKLPTFFYNNLSSQLQLISSQMGVWLIRLFDISVYLEGNVIDLGAMKLQVVEACSGLRYLFPLMALSLILAIFFKGPLWMRVLIFFSSMPVTVFMNSFRIGVIGITVEYWGKEMAEGFLHDFEGWVVFMSALLMLLLEIMIVIRITGDRRPLTDVLALELPPPRDPAQPTRPRSIPTHFFVAAAVLLAFTFVNQSMVVTESVHPAREKLDRFPLFLGDRIGTTSVLEGIYLQELQVDDYLLTDYRSNTGQSINFYVAYYEVQAEGAGTIHSPRSCLPGSGWRIKEITQQPLQDVQISGVPLTVNRAIIAKDNQQVLVYYWMQQRGRVITNEFMAKWWIFWDRLTKGRSDGALVRVMVELDAFGNVDAAEQQLRHFVAETAPYLPRFIPD